VNANPLRICHVLLSLRPGGLENGVVTVINGLDPLRFASTVCCLQESGPFAQRIRQADVPIEAMGLKPGTDLSLPLRLAKLFRRWRIDVVHTRNAESFFYGAVASTLGGVKRLIHSEHGRVFPETPRRAFIQRVLMRRADFAFAVSHRLKHDLVREIGLAEAQLGVIHNGVDVSRFRKAGALRSTVSRGPLVIGSVGRLVAVKNYGLLLQAVARLPSTLDWRLVLIGDGPERASLEAQASSLAITDRVTFAGHCDDVPARLASMDVFVLPSISEGLSNTLLEAMAAGCALIASDVGGNSEIVHDGVTGRLFASGDVEGLTRQLVALGTDEALRSRYVAAGNAEIDRDFSLERMIENYADMYSRVAATGAS
jgi:sugar transferase (PEP-CTERM/EpsH1 system associated)